MADALLGSTVQVLLEKTISLASEQIGLFVGFKKDLEELKKSSTMIQAFLEDAEKKQINENSVKLWLKKLERVAFDAGNLLDDFNYEILHRKVTIQNQMKRKICFFFSPSNPVAFRCRMVNKIKNINSNLERINEEASKLSLMSQIGAKDAITLLPPKGFRKSRQTDSVTIDTSFVGRDDDVSKIVAQLTATINNESVCVLPIVGMGGIGKTTLARKVFNDLKIKKHFDKRIWVCISDDFDVDRLFGLILESIQLQKPKAESREAKVKQLKELLDGKKYLLIIDDVWNEEVIPWNDFLGSLRGISSAKGNCILVTTRKQPVATITGTSSSSYSLKQLSDDKCWLILKENAFGSGEVPEGLQDIGFQIAQKCQGLPLAASVLGGMLRNKGRDAWLITLETELQNLGGDEDNSVNQILKLSFDHLPYPSLKNCFAYCSIFPKDFKLKKDQLIQLWVAEGFLHSNTVNTMSMEKVGDIFFSILLDSNLLQDVEIDEHGNVRYCKMHDLMHDLVQSISKSKTTSLKDSTRVRDHEIFPIRYLTLERSGGEEISFPFCESFRYITTLFLFENTLIDDRVISFLKCLRVLNLRLSNVKMLPKSFGKLSRLRYLDVSYARIEILPNSFCELYNLETLRVRNCISLRKFPKNFKNLVNLRHFDFYIEDNSSDVMPLEIGRLNCLRTLPFFNIGKEKGRQIGELKSLEHLSGSFEIRNLELVKGKEEAEFANLINKSNIEQLGLFWGNDRSENEKKENQVLEGLQPHRNVKGLIIGNFSGDQFSTWVGILVKLVKLELRNCKKCKELPTLGDMPFLKTLKLVGLDGITSIGPSFYDESTGHPCSSSRESKKLFPALEFLIIKDMQNLIDWTEVSPQTSVFPVLEKIDIGNCPQLATAPSYFLSLKKLLLNNINHGLEVITKICSGLSTLTSLNIKNVRELTELPSGLFRNNPNLGELVILYCLDLTQFLDFKSGGVQHLETQNNQSHSNSNNKDDYLVALVSLKRLIIHDCHGLKSVSIPRGHQYLSGLRHLQIFSCNGLTHISIPQIFESEGDYTSLLEELNVYECPNLTSFPLNLNRIHSLYSLDLTECDKLTTLPMGRLSSLTRLTNLGIGPFSNTTELHSFQNLFGDDCVQQQKNVSSPSLPSSLSYLVLYGWPHWESLPDQIQHLSALEFLELHGFGIKSLPDWFGKLSSLEDLRIYNCEKLECLPSHQLMASLTKLRCLTIEACPLLERRCSPENGSGTNSDWSKISHIPRILINGRRVK
ncbi:hypothetical protein ACH5RR_032878 [Cinchona calisaya]|uniref:Disease resistance protein RGA3 n=1 Tax=Cinchona calisaya TaxID=153742 RepID=A0ABD2YKP7_9GENT